MGMFTLRGHAKEAHWRQQGEGEKKEAKGKKVEHWIGADKGRVIVTCSHNTLY